MFLLPQIYNKHLIPTTFFLSLSLFKHYIYQKTIIVKKK